MNTEDTNDMPRMRLLTLLVVSVVVVAGCAGEPTSTTVPTSTPTTIPTPTPTSRPLPENAKAEIGVRYLFSIYTHCGVSKVSFDGRDWVPDPPLESLRSWDDPFESGTMELESEDLAMFRTHSGEVVHFRPPPIYERLGGRVCWYF